MRIQPVAVHAAVPAALVVTTFAAVMLLGASETYAQDADIGDRYEKREYMVPMRDGVRLFTAVYMPRDRSERYPILMLRTPYSCRPYGEGEYRDTLGPSELAADDGFIFVYQDVRGRFMSEGLFENMRPHIDVKSSPDDIDEASDTFDTIAWLLQNVANNNGRVGMWGISYPGFYAAAGMIDAHPALIAVSPQAPIADWYFDDFHHHGAFFLPHCFNFMASFGRARLEPTSSWGTRFDHGTPDGYEFFLELGPLSNANERYLHGEIAFWNEICAHPDYDEFWKSRDLLPHLHRVPPAVLTVGGWFDAEDLYGPLQIYRAVERANPDVFNVLVMGPWRHGGWARTDGERLGNIEFGARTSLFYREHIELPFFRHYLKDGEEHDLPEAYVFETGSNQWRRFDDWPPADARRRRLYCSAGGGLTWNEPSSGEQGWSEYVSDPSRPVPFTEAIATGMTREYMTDDQRFAARRPDVVVFQTEVLEQDLTLAGPVVADLWVSTSGTASDWVVKLIDVFPPDASDPEELPHGRRMGGYQMMVRSEVIRGRYRDGYDAPRPFEPNEPTLVRLPLQDVLHTFQPGHRLMIQVQSTWFPLVDRNPQAYVDNIFEAEESDFIVATQRVHHSRAYATSLELLVLDAGDE